MKKKLPFLILMVFVLPLFAFFGCNEVTYFSVTAYSSSTIFGSVSGTGTYESGSTITLTATAKQNSTVIGWLYQNTTLLSNENGYTITTSDDKTNSTLSFESKEATQGRYTAVFEDSKMMYVKLDSYQFETEEPITLLSMSVLQGNNTSSMSEAYKSDEQKEIATQEAYPITTNQVLKLSASSSSVVEAEISVIVDNTQRNFNLVGYIDFQKEKSGTNYTSTYKNGTYNMALTFTYNDKTYTLILNMKNLTNKNEAV